MDGAGASEPPILGAADVAAVPHVAECSTRWAQPFRQSMESVVCEAGGQMDYIHVQAACGDGNDDCKCGPPHMLCGDGRRDPSSVRPRLTVWLSVSHGQDPFADDPNDGAGVPVPHFSTLSEPALAFFFRLGWFWNRGDGDRVRDAACRRAIRHLAAVFSVVPPDAGTRKESAEYRGRADDQWNSGPDYRGSRLRGLLPARGDLTHSLDSERE
jgi:hypothetical protein